MKKSLLLFFSLVSISIQAQNPSYKEKLFYTCKVWGFVKYYHSRVSTCQVDWDSALVRRLPHIKNALTNNDFNNELDTLLQMAGPMAIATSPPPAPIAPELRRNLNFNWINNSFIRNDIKVKLDTIKNNFRPHASCWVENNTWSGANNSWLIFPHDSLMLNTSTMVSFPNEFNRLLVGFKYWNIINYFYPYNYVLDEPCDSILSHKIMLYANAATPQNFLYAITKTATSLNDAHAVTTPASNGAPFYYYTPRVKVMHTRGQYIVVKSNIPAISRGDAIVSVNGVTPRAMEDSLRPFISAGDSSVFYRTMNSYLFNGNLNTPVVIGYSDSVGVNHTISCNRTDPYFHTYFNSVFNDTLNAVKWKNIGCNTGYVNMGTLLPSDVSAMYNDLMGTDAIIFDLRNYPNGTAWDIADLMYPGLMTYAKLTEPDVNYPGTFLWYYSSIGGSSSNPYNGQVIILMNEETQSQAEYSCMMLGAMPNSIKVGSQTAGADGNISYLRIAPNIKTYYSNLGVFYPNGDSTQRIGIVPDSVVRPSAAGIRHHRDEVLEKALQIVNCTVMSVKDIADKKEDVNLFPNPAKNTITIQSTDNSTLKTDYEITDVLGKTVFQNRGSGSSFTINLSDLNSGVYFIHLKVNNSLVAKKFVKE